MSRLLHALIAVIPFLAPSSFFGQVSRPPEREPVARSASVVGRPLPVLARARVRPLIQNAPARPSSAITISVPFAGTLTLADAEARAMSRVGAPQTGRRARLPLVFYGALAAGAGAAAAMHIDPDSGGYRDGWATATDFPDKAIHALVAWAITTVGVDLGARPRTSAIAVCAAGVAFEFAQGYASAYDIAADCTGAAGAALWQSWRARRKSRRPARS